MKTPPLLEIQGLQVYTRQNKPLLQDVDFQIQPGERVGIKGESGSGKTLLVKALLGLLPSELTSHTEKHYFQKEAYKLNLKTAAAKATRLWYRDYVAMIFQNAQTSLNPLQKIETQLKETLALKGREAEWSPELLHAYGLDDPASIVKRYPHQCSGGDLQKLMLFQAIAKGANLIIADEPTVSLDKPVEKQLFELFDLHIRTNGIASILISHDDNLLAQFCDRIYVMQEGRLEGRLKASSKNKEALPPNAVKESGSAVPKTIIAVENLSVTYHTSGLIQKKSTPALQGINMEVFEDEILAIAGLSGSGKSTLIKSLTGLLTPETGNIYINQEPVGSIDRKSLAKKIQVLHQNPDLILNPLMSVGGLLTEPFRYLQGYHKQKSEALAKAMLQKLGLKEQLWKSRPAQLSGGEKQRVALGRILAAPPQLLILDEPFSAVDGRTKELITTLILRLKKEFNFTLLIISHDLVTVSTLADRIIILDRGRIIEQGPTKKIFNDPQHATTKALGESNFASHHFKTNYE